MDQLDAALSGIESECCSGKDLAFEAIPEAISCGQDPQLTFH